MNKPLSLRFAPTFSGPYMYLDQERMEAERRRGYPYPIPPLAAPPPSTGFTAPAVTYDKMRQMQSGSAEPLDRDIRTNVFDAVFLAAWNSWYRQAWLPFYEKYAGPNASTTAKLAAAFESDAIAMRAEAYRQQLESFYASYRQQRTAAGAPVPAPSGAPPVLGGLPPGGGLGLPWWVWGLGIAAAGGIGYLGYLKVKELRAKRTALEKKVLPKLIGKDLAEAAAAR